MAYPTGTELADFLVGRGILTAVPGDLDDLNTCMLDVVQQWEKDTGWIPFLSPGGDITRTYDLEGNLLFLECGLLTCDSLEIDGNELTEGTNFWLQPANEDRKTRILFANLQASAVNGIEINGHWGYTDDMDTLPDVQQALLRKGAAEFLRDIENTVVGKGGAVVESRQDDVQKKYGSYTGLMGEYDGSLQQQFGRSYDKAVGRYKAPWMTMA